MSDTFKTIVVVDDDPNVGLLISVILKNIGYSVVSLSNGKDLLSYLANNSKPGLILLDLKLPDIDGYELCKRIRDNQFTSDVPIIVLTGVSEVDSKIKTIEMGADDYISKPFDVRELKVRIKRILKRKDNDSSLNPLTKLPGGPLIEEFTRKKLEVAPDFSYAYIDIDNFKAYNDVYGYTKGDAVIKFLADLLEKVLKENSKGDYFLGHVGGDDFVVLAPNDKIIRTVEGIIEEFDTKIRDYYSIADRQAGYITTTDRMNNIKTFPIMTLSIAIVSVRKSIPYAKIIENIFEIKRFLKSRPAKNKSIYHKDRRINE
ncbi:MAG: response regulator [Elusimicrobiales bacterium]|jgi:diguanylate cyclase (GGDEF)-like protein|nr:response regulator [Elusimicrobiales bacterium]